MVSTAIKVTGALVGIAVLLVGVWCANLGIWSLDDFRNYQSMCSWRHPIIEALRSGELGSGAATADLLNITEPVWKEDYGRLVYYHYTPRLSFSSIRVTTADGRVASATAGSCTWHWTFFDHAPEDLIGAATVVHQIRLIVERSPEIADRCGPSLREACATLDMQVE